MSNALTLSERLRDLRNEKKLKLFELEEATGISASTLQRLEDTDDIRVGYQDILTLARFYDVRPDYLFDYTDNRKYKNVQLQELHLSDDAVEVLKNGEINNRLVSELISHPDFPNLLNGMEIYIDQKITPQMSAMNAIYKYIENAIKEEFDVSKKDDVIKLLKEMTIDEGDYLLHRISERFNNIMKSLFEKHKKDAQRNEQLDIVKEIADGIDTYKTSEKNAKRKMLLWAKHADLNLSKLSREEIDVLLKAIQRESGKYKRVKSRKK